jgi:hypothetical protein
MLWPLYPRGNSCKYTLDRRLDGAQSRSGRCGEDSLPLPGIESRSLSRPARTAIAMATGLPCSSLEDVEDVRLGFVLWLSGLWCRKCVSTIRLNMLPPSSGRSHHIENGGSVFYLNVDIHIPDFVDCW